MKQIGFIILVVLLVTSCQFGSKRKSVSETLSIAYKPKGAPQNQWQLASVSCTIRAQDTFNWKVLQPNPKDTIRGVNNKPSYDSLRGTYRFNNIWVEIADSEFKKFDIVFLPKNVKDTGVPSH